MFTLFKFWNAGISRLNWSDKLHDAVKSGDKIKVTELLNAGFYIDTENLATEQTPLFIATIKGDEEMVRLLLSKGADPRIHAAHGKLAYHHAIENGYLNLIELFVNECRVSVNSTYGHERKIPPSKLAADEGRIDVLNLLKDLGCQIDSESYQRAAIVQSLSQYKKEVGIQCGDALSALKHAVQSRDAINLSKLLENPGIQEKINSLIDITPNKALKLTYPNVYKQFQNNEQWLQRGMSDIEIIDNSHQATLLFQAILNDSHECVKSLLLNGANVDEPIHGYTPLQLSTTLNLTDITTIIQDTLDKRLYQPKQLTR